mmetsp:Transcript_10537/g.42597  ORF Transcript_10537/g.42597 Transcript_10537/m.42597 type:complete len:350 (-) Transcript_10537:1056-2105(-)
MVVPRDPGRTARRPKCHVRRPAEDLARRRGLRAVPLEDRAEEGRLVAERAHVGVPEVAHDAQRHGLGEVAERLEAARLHLEALDAVEPEDVVDRVAHGGRERRDRRGLLGEALRRVRHVLEPAVAAAATPCSRSAAAAAEGRPFPTLRTTGVVAVPPRSTTKRLARVVPAAVGVRRMISRVVLLLLSRPTRAREGGAVRGATTTAVLVVVLAAPVLMMVLMMAIRCGGPSGGCPVHHVRRRAVGVVDRRSRTAKVVMVAAVRAVRTALMMIRRHGVVVRRRPRERRAVAAPFAVPLEQAAEVGRRRAHGREVALAELDDHLDARGFVEVGERVEAARLHVVAQLRVPRE